MLPANSTGCFMGNNYAQKISGIYTTDGLTMPHSRYFTIPLESVLRGDVLAGSET
jgi:homoserine O-succinyltransferase